MKKVDGNQLSRSKLNIKKQKFCIVSTDSTTAKLLQLKDHYIANIDLLIIAISQELYSKFFQIIILIFIKKIT